MSNYLGHLVTSSGTTITTDEGILTVPASHLSFDAVKESLKVGDFVTAIKLSDAALSINEFGQGQVYVKDGVVFWNGHALHNSLTKRIASMVREGYNCLPMLSFLGKLMKNPSSRAVNELYRFLEANNLPITPDGNFLAYKSVAEDYKDRYSGTNDHSIGAVVTMPRNEVMDDPNQTCSSGLHFCSMEYLQGFWGTGGHVMVLSIDPADVVSIPVDYNNSKGRCAKYTVVAEHMDGEKDTLSDSSVWGTDEYDPMEDDSNYYNDYDDEYDPSGYDY